MNRAYEIDEPTPMLYVDKKHRVLHEVRLFDDFALVRVATPGFQSDLMKIPTGQFSTEFEEYLGDVEYVRALMYGMEDKYPLVLN